MDAHSPLHYQAQTMHKLNSELISQHFAMLLLFTLALANLHEGSKVGVAFAVLGLLWGYATWRMVVEGFSIAAITGASLIGMAFGGISFAAYLMA